MKLAQQLIPTGGLPDVSAIDVGLALVGSFVLSMLVAWIYRATHRGLSYSQSFQFSLVIIGMLAAAVMMIARASLLQAIGILGVFALVRFRTIVKDTKDMAYILFVLTVGLAMGTQMYALGVLTAAFVGIVILVLTRVNFGMTTRHEAVVRLMLSSDNGTGTEEGAHEESLSRLTDSFTLLSAHAHGNRMELTYGVRPGRGVASLAILEALRAVPYVENAELFDAKHQVEF